MLSRILKQTGRVLLTVAGVIFVALPKILNALGAELQRTWKVVNDMIATVKLNKSIKTIPSKTVLYIVERLLAVSAIVYVLIKIM